MNLDYKRLKNTYIHLFQNNEKCDYVLTDVLFAFKEFYSFIDDNKVNKILEIGSGTGILLKELSQIFKNKMFYGLDPHKKGFYNYKNVSENISNKNLVIVNEDFSKFKPINKFDLIISFNVFEHVDDPNNYIKVVDTLLKSDGKSIILCPNYDFPYEPHFVLPIIYNKNLTYKIFKNRIINHERKTGEKGLWKGLNLCSKKKIENYLKKNKYSYYFDNNIGSRLLSRIHDDKSNFFQKRQGIMAKIAKIGMKLKLDKIFFNFLKIPFPYMKLIIKKKI